MKNPFPWICLLLGVCAEILAQPLLKPEEFNIQQGLSQGFVPCLLQDQEGFLWAGTKNGLNRYDGRAFVAFTHDPDNPRSLSHDFAWSLAEHGDFLLVANDGGVLDFFHKKTLRAAHLPLAEGNATKVPVVQHLFVDAAGHIWLVAGDGASSKLFVVRTPPNFWEQLCDKPELVKNLTLKPFFERKIYSALMDKGGKTLFLDTPLGFFSLNTETEQLTAYPHAPGYPVVPLSFRSRLKADAQGRVWLVWQQTLQCFDRQGFQEFPIDFKQTNFVGTTPDGLLLIATEGKLLGIPAEKIRAAGRVQAALATWALPLSGSAQCLLVDRSGNLWMGMIGTGIAKVGAAGRRQLRHLFAGESIYGAVFCEPNGMVGYLGADHIRFTPDNGDSPLLRIAREKNANPPGLWRITTDRQGVRWLFATQRSGASLLFKVLPDGRFYSFPLPVSVFGQVGNLTTDPADGAVWMAWPRLLLRFDPAGGTWQQFSFQQLLPYEQEVLCLRTMPSGSVWIGTQRGLLEAKPDGAGGRAFKLYQNEAGNPNSLRNNAVSSLLPDPTDPNALWIGTKGGGLSRLDTRTGQFSHLNSRQGGLPNDVIYGILPDAKGNLWMSSNKGMIRFTPATGKISNFTEADGLQSDEFNTWAYGPGPKGTLMFGGINGLNVFSPERFEDNPHLPPVFLTGLKINNRPVAPGDSTGILPQAIEFLKKIDLSFEQRSATLEFAALEFTAPTKNHFRWMLEGAENDWHPATTACSATYLNLSPGHYTFKVMASNGDLLWNPTPAVLEIVVHPPWWRSWWAWLFYTFLLGAVLRMFFLFQTRRRLEQAEMRFLKELDAFKSQLYINITHEFRTPLTVILGLAREVKSDPAGWTKERLVKAFDPIERNGARLLRLINQMLDLAKLENKALQVELRRGDVVAYLKYVLESFQSLANARNLVLRFRSPLQTFEMDFDPERLAQIVSNLVFNALKNTPPGGQVSLRVEADGLKGSAFEKLTPRNVATLPSALGQLHIAVADTGTGIPEAALPHIFERFYQVKKDLKRETALNRFDESENSGTGIGLALTRELVRLFGGDIRVESRTEGPEQGTVFTVSLPVTRQAPELFDAAAQTSFGIEHELTRIPSENETLLSPSLPVLLLVEDNADVVDFLRALLEPAYQVRVAYNGRAGMETAFETVPDVVVSDLMMPEMDGLQLCDALKNDPRTSHVPVVLLTARAAVEDRVAGLSRGADAYLVKPVHREELLVTLAQLIGLRQKLQARYAVPGASPPLTEDKGLQVEDAFLQQLRTIVEKNIAKADLSVQEICRAMGMSHPVIHRKVTALTGRSLVLYVRSLRLQRARALLADPARSISDVAYEVGFNDPKFFSRVFSEEFGVSPTGFRQGM